MQKCIRLGSIPALLFHDPDYDFLYAVAQFLPQPAVRGGIDIDGADGHASVIKGVASAGCRPACRECELRPRHGKEPEALEDLSRNELPADRLHHLDAVVPDGGLRLHVLPPGEHRWNVVFPTGPGGDRAAL